MMQNNTKIRAAVVAGLSILLMTLVFGIPKLAITELPSIIYTSSANAEPPPWAPAHGYRAKHQYH